MDLKFCDDCENLMDFCLNETSEPIFVCSRCSKKEVVTDPKQLYVVEKKQVNVEEIINTNEFLKLDPTLPVIQNKNIRCVNINCPSKQSKLNEINYIKYDEDQLKFMYICKTCGQKWTNTIM